MSEVKKSCKGSSCLAYCEQLIKELDPHQDLSRPAIFNRAIEKAKAITEQEWIELSVQLKKFKNNVPKDINAPTAIQMRVDDALTDDLVMIENKIITALNLRTLQTRYEVEILEYQYLEVLKKDVLIVGEKNELPSETDLNGPEMVKRLVEILLLNRESDKKAIEKIKTILLEWKE